MRYLQFTDRLLMNSHPPALTLYPTQLALSRTLISDAINQDVRNRKSPHYG
jgi:hypothetical protein